MCCIEISTLTFHCITITCSLATKLLCGCNLGDIAHTRYGLEAEDRRAQGKRHNVLRSAYVVVHRDGDGRRHNVMRRAYMIMQKSDRDS